MIRDLYSAVMDPEQNPLAKLPRVVAFQLMTSLAWMWSIVFSFWMGSLAVFGPSVAVHSMLLIGVFFTADIFAMARKQRQIKPASVAAERKSRAHPLTPFWTNS